MAVVFDEVLASVDSPNRGAAAQPSGSQGDEPAAPERDSANFARTRATLRLIEHRQIRLRAT